MSNPLQRNNIPVSSHRRCYFLPLTCVLIAISLASASPAAAATIAKTAALVPQETILLLDIDDFAKTRTQFEKTILYKLYKDPAMAAFFADFRTKWQQRTRSGNNDILYSIADSNLLPAGRAAFALVLDQPAKDPNSAAMLTITQWGQNLLKIREIIDKACGKAVSDGAHRKTEQYRGVNIETIIGPGADANSISYCFIDDCLIASTNIDILNFVVAHIKGASSPALAADSDYIAATAAVGPYHDFDLYVNIKQMIRVSLAHSTNANLKLMITNLGIDNLVSFACAVGLARTPQASCSARMFVGINGPKKGICRMLELKSAPVRIPGFIPASTYSATILNLDVRSTYTELYKIMYAFNPVSAAALNPAILPPQSPDSAAGLDLKTGFIDHLGCEIVITSAVDLSALSASLPVRPQSIFAVAVNNRQAIEKSLSLIYEQFVLPQNPQAKRDLHSYTLYVISPTAFPFLTAIVNPIPTQQANSTTKPSNLALTVTDSHLIFGTEKTVEQAIQTLNALPGQTVQSTKWFAACRQTMPTAVGIACLNDGVSSAQLLWQTLRQTAGLSHQAAGPAALVGIGRVSFAGLMNPSLLPEFGAVRNYFGPSVFYGMSRPDGFFFEFSSLKPAGAD